MVLAARGKGVDEADRGRAAVPVRVQNAVKHHQRKHSEFHAIIKVNGMQKRRVAMTVRYKHLLLGRIEVIGEVADWYSVPSTVLQQHVQVAALIGSRSDRRPPITGRSRNLCRLRHRAPQHGQISNSGTWFTCLRKINAVDNLHEQQYFVTLIGNLNGRIFINCTS